MAETKTTKAAATKKASAAKAEVKAPAKKAKLTEGDTILGLGWLLKEGKVASTEDNKIILA